MTFEQVLALGNQGLTLDQITQIGKIFDNQNVTVAPVAPVAPVATVAPVAPVAPVAQTKDNQTDSQILAEIQKLQQTMAANAILQTQMPQEQSIEDMIATVIAPPAPMEGVK